MAAAVASPTLVSTYSLFAASVFAVGAATLEITLLPALMPSLPIVTVVTVGAVPGAAFSGTACVFVIVSVSPSKTSLVPAPSVVVAFVTEVIPTKSFVKPISSLPSSVFLVRILFAAVVAPVATVPSPTISKVSPNCFLMPFASLPWNVKPFAMISVAVLFKSLTLTAACFVLSLFAAVFKLSKNVGLAPSAAAAGITEATLLNTVVPPVVVPSGFTKRACGFVTSTASAAFVPSALTLPAGYHLPSLAFTTRLPFSSVYTTVPASPLRSAFTFVVKSLPFRPSTAVKPSLPIPASAPVPGLPSRPSTPLVPTALAMSFTLSNFAFASSDKPMITLPLSPVSICKPALAASAVAVVPSPVTKSKPFFKDTDLAASSATPFARYVIGASRSFTVTVASPKFTLPGSAALVT